MHNPHKTHSRRENPFKELLFALERAYSLPAWYHYVSHESHPGAGDTSAAPLPPDPAA
jgi:hypothetical protein